MSQLPAITPAQAKLPQTYEAAREALAACQNIDECKNWSDRAAALASYAKQAEDETLMKMATRIKARAVRRSGELLKQIEPARGGDRRSDQWADARPLVSRSDAARDAGMSPHQAKQAGRVANVPAEEFEALVESDSPPTVTELARQGTTPKPRPILDLKGRDPSDFNKAMHFVGAFDHYARELSRLSIDDVLPVLIDDEREELRRIIGEIDAIHDRIITRI